jgi:hypothetical protein
MREQYDREDRTQPNPWFSPPAMQYLSRFTGNPRGPAPMPFTEWKEFRKKGHGELDYLMGYTGPPGFAQNPQGFRAGERVTWSEEALDMGMGRPGQIMRVRYPGQHREDADRTSIEFESGRSRMVNNWEIVRVPSQNPEGEAHHQVLCQCGWGSLSMPESQIPDYCPVCSHPVGVCEACGLRKSECECYLEDESFGPTGRHPLSDFYRRQGQLDAEDPDYDARPNPDRYVNAVEIRGRRVPVEHSARGKYHHVRVGEPGQYTAIRTKTLSESKGIKARIGRIKGRGARGGKTEIQSYLSDAGRYTPQDVVRWMEGHRTPPPLLVMISSAGATKRRMKVYGESPEAPAKKRRKVKRKVAARKKKAKKKKAKKRRVAGNPKKRRSRPVPPAAQRCVEKKKDRSRCKGRRLPGQKVCVCHSSKSSMKRSG